MRRHAVLVPSSFSSYAPLDEDVALCVDMIVYADDLVLQNQLSLPSLSLSFSALHVYCDQVCLCMLSCEKVEPLTPKLEPKLEPKKEVEDGDMRGRVPPTRWRWLGSQQRRWP